MLNFAKQKNNTVMYYLHYEQLRLLTTCFGLTQKQFSVKCFEGKEHVWPQRMCKLDNILVTDLVSICNTFHIPLDAFINTSKTPTLKKDDTVAIKKGFKPLLITKQNIKELYLGNHKKVTKELICKELNVSLSTFYCWINYPKRFAMKAHQLVTLCNRFGFSPYAIIEDPNGPADTHKLSFYDLESIKLQLRQQIVQMEETIEKSKAIIDELDNVFIRQ